MENKRKVKIHCPLQWDHHRMGWSHVVARLQELHCPGGVDFFTNGVVPMMIENYKTSYVNDWIGIMHTTPSDQNFDKNLMNNKKWHESLKSCHGMFTLSEYSKSHLERFVKNITTVEKLMHPLYPNNIRFNWTDFEKNKNKKLYFLGHWRRSFDLFYKLKCDYEKTIVRCFNKKIMSDPTVRIIDYLPPNEYDNLFIDNIVFLTLEDASANNTVLECINSNTPIIINRHPAIQEYLGESYPLFYDDLKHAEELLNNIDKIKAGHDYLVVMDKSQFSLDNFVKSIVNSSIYRNLPTVIKAFL